MTDSSSADDTIRRPLSVTARDAQQPTLSGVGGTAGQQDFADRFGDTTASRQGDEGLDDNDIFGFTPPLSGSVDSPASSEIDRALDLAAPNPLVGAAAPLLWLAGRLNESAPPDDVDQFRERVLQELKLFETAAMARDVAPRLVRMGRYALAATIDDIVLNTEWGGHTAWANRSLVSLLYNETWGGERFFDLLSQMRLNAEENIDGLELMAICMAIGFTGKYRVMEDGRTQLSHLRYALYRSIREVRGAYDRDLSPPWQQVTAAHVAPKSMAGAWMIAVLVALLLAGLWVASSISLHRRVAAVTARIDALAPKAALAVAQPKLPDLSQPPIVHIRQFLAAEIEAGRVTVTREQGHIVIRLPKVDFASGDLMMAPSTEPLVARIGAALDGVKGPIRIIGYTDDIPVVAGSPLGDNVAVSRKRAQAMAAMLRRHVDDPSRITAEGRGATNPIASNDSAAGRSSNRRVEIWLGVE